MGDEVDRVIACHVLFLQEVGGIAFALRKNRHEDVCACDFIAARALDMNGSALDHTLEGGCGNGLGAFDVGDKVGEIFLDKFDKALT